MTSPRFTPAAVAFLRALKRHNDREWFKARKEQYDLLLRGPMIAVIERLGHDFVAFAPDLVANAKTSLYRIYRDTRFSDNKAPLKTHIAAVFPCGGLAKHQGAGLYLEVAPTWVWAGGGMYAPVRPNAPCETLQSTYKLPNDRGIAGVPAPGRTARRERSSGSCAVSRDHEGWLPSIAVPRGP